MGRNEQEFERERELSNFVLYFFLVENYFLSRSWAGSGVFAFGQYRFWILLCFVFRDRYLGFDLSGSLGLFTLDKGVI